MKHGSRQPLSSLKRIAHPFPYQGSKRRLAPLILRFVPTDTRTLIEPFAGSAAMAIAVAFAGRADQFVLNDVHKPLIALWTEIINHPKRLCEGYRALWDSQHGRDRVFYDEVRERFNREHQPADFLYLLARCVKAAIRYNAKGEFNNSPDKRRKGMLPDTMQQNIQDVANIFAGRTELRCESYIKTLKLALPGDLVYMDPPYQGVCDTHNHRYSSGIEFEEFVAGLEDLNARSISYIVSYDGRTGGKTHGRKLPDTLDLVHEEIFAGRSTQATLLGRDDETYESIYLSPALVERLGDVAHRIKKMKEEPLQFITPPENEIYSSNLINRNNEKSLRIKYQEMAYAAMSFIDSILGLNARQGNGTTVENFHSNLALARTARNDRAKDQALRDFVVDAGRCSELSPGSNARVVRIAYLKALLPRYGVVDPDHPSKMSADALDSGAIAEADKGMNELKAALDARAPSPADFAAGNFAGRHIIDLAAARPQCQPFGMPAPQTWDDYEKGCHATYGGGYREEREREIFRHGMTTIFNMLRSEFKPPSECRK